MTHLSKQQHDQVCRATALLPPHGHDAFLRNIAGVLADHARPTNDDVGRAISLCLSITGIAAGDFSRRRSNNKGNSHVQNSPTHR